MNIYQPIALCGAIKTWYIQYPNFKYVFRKPTLSDSFVDGEVFAWTKDLLAYYSSIPVVIIQDEIKQSSKSAL